MHLEERGYHMFRSVQREGEHLRRVTYLKTRIRVPIERGGDAAFTKPHPRKVPAESWSGAALAGCRGAVIFTVVGSFSAPYIEL